MTEVSEQMFQSTPEIATLTRVPVAGPSAGAMTADKAEGFAIDPLDPHDDAEAADALIPAENFGATIALEQINPALAQAFGQLSLDLSAGAEVAHVGAGEDLPSTGPSLAPVDAESPADAALIADALADETARPARQQVPAAPFGHVLDAEAPIAAATLQEYPLPRDPGTANASTAPPASEHLAGRKDTTADLSEVAGTEDSLRQASGASARPSKDAANAVSEYRNLESLPAAPFAASPPQALDGAYSLAATSQIAPQEMSADVYDARTATTPDAGTNNARDLQLITADPRAVAPTEVDPIPSPAEGTGESATATAIRFLWQDIAPKELSKGDLTDAATFVAQRNTFHDAPAPLPTDVVPSAEVALDADIAGIAVLRSRELRTAKPEGTLKAQKPEEDAKADSVAAQGFTAENRADATQTDPALKSVAQTLQTSGLHGNEQADNALPAAGLSGAAPLAAPSHDPGIERITSPFTPQTPVKQVVQTIANNLHMSPGQMNLTLTPDTLGRVHFEMRPEQNGLSITLSAENPDTLDLMRRHLPDLVAELKQAGIQAGNFSFSSWQDRPQAIAPPPVEAAEPEFPIPLAPTPLLRPVSSAPKGALDLRV